MGSHLYRYIGPFSALQIEGVVVLAGGTITLDDDFVADQDRRNQQHFVRASNKEVLSLLPTENSSKLFPAGSVGLAAQGLSTNPEPDPEIRPEDSAEQINPVRVVIKQEDANAASPQP